MSVVKTCKDCDSTDLFKGGRCKKHFYEIKNKWHREWVEKNRHKNREYYENEKRKMPKIICKSCGKEAAQSPNSSKQFCSRVCQSDYWKKHKLRVGENNPAYKSGIYQGGGWANSGTGKIHLAECRRYRTKFLKENDYVFCERCGVSNSLRFEVHHIVFASEAPKHENLHNHKNLIMLCIGCHNELHKHKHLRNEIVEQRNLNSLFDRNLFVYERKPITEVNRRLPGHIGETEQACLYKE